MQVTDRTVGANPTGFDMRTELNNIIGALESDNSGSSEPLNTVAGMKWMDTSNATYYYVKERNHDNTAWVTLFRYTVATKVIEAVSNGVVLQDSALVHKTGNETIAGIKTFSSSPIVPNATTATQAIAYGQAVKNTGDETIAGVKTFSSNTILNGNVGIGTSSPANSKFNRTFTTQVTGASSVAITAGDYSALSGSTVTAVESFGNRYDTNGSFGGRFGVSYRRSDGVAIPAGNTIGYYAFGGQWGTDVGYVPSKHLYTASICGVSEGAFTSDTAMPTGISFRTGSTGESLGAVNTTYGTERMRIDSSGNVLLTSGTGGLGYGAGAGGKVTQLTSKSTAVTLNKPCGQIIMSNSSLAAGASALFSFNNSLVTQSDQLLVELNNDFGGNYSIRSYISGTSNGVVGIYLTNVTGVTLSDSVTFNFIVLKGATA